MAFMDSMQTGLEKIMGPFAQKLSESKIVAALTAGMMTTLPITLGVAAFAVIANLPIPVLQSFLTHTGMLQHMLDLVSATSSLLAIYITPAVAYHYGKNEGESGIITALMSVAAFIILMPQTVTSGKEEIAALSTTYLGSNGIFVGMIIALVIAICYTKLMKKGIKLKLPSSVPPNVSESLSPTFVAMILFTGIFALRYLVGLTSYGNIFELVNSTVAQPVMLFGSSPISMIFFMTFLNFCWFFGIHPAPLLGVYLPIIMAANTKNIEAFLSGTPSAQLPHLTFALMYTACYIGGTGNTLSLAFVMFTAKSERYKALRNVATVPNIFNINEPMIFGVPIMLNPIFFIPMIATGLIGGAMGYAAVQFLGAGASFNPTVQLPWVMPPFIGPFISGGWRLGLMVIAIIIVQLFIWYPFFKIADNQAYKEEQAG